LWERTSSRTGKRYLTGRLGLARLLIVPNPDKVTERDPDFHAYLAAVEETRTAAPRSEAPAPAKARRDLLEGCASGGARRWEPGRTRLCAAACRLRLAPRK
jgi:hypothetical protein